MPAKRVNPCRIKLHHNYTAGEAAARLGVHKNTVLHWQDAGLKPIDGQRPLLFQGRTIRAFLEQRRAKGKRPCPPGTLYCLKCRTPRPPALGMVDYRPFNSASGNLSALCAACGTVMHRRIGKAQIANKMPGFTVQIAGG